ncbi:hypothetical protein ON010_g4118 [Phytophthora cinnamomi]|nr:hypothetical protein ON010_g4118 [Phytophthora cinnamomi]
MRGLRARNSPWRNLRATSSGMMSTQQFRQEVWCWCGTAYTTIQLRTASCGYVDLYQARPATDEMLKKSEAVSVAILIYDESKLWATGQGAKKALVGREMAVSSVPISPGSTPGPWVSLRATPDFNAIA